MEWDVHSSSIPFMSSGDLNLHQKNQFMGVGPSPGGSTNPSSKI